MPESVRWKKKTEVRKTKQGQSESLRGEKGKGRDRFVGAAETSKELEDFGESLRTLGLPNRKGLPYRYKKEKLAKTPKPPLLKRKGTEISIQTTRS